MGGDVDKWTRRRNLPSASVKDKACLLKKWRN
jgi:hypothetical protein